MKHHKLADLFPLMSSEELTKLTEDIRENGQRAPITILDGMILDGRNRFLACDRAGVIPKLKDFGGGDPLAFVLSANLHRRHLNESQRAMVAAKIADLHPGNGSEFKCANLRITPTQPEAAEMLNVSRRSVQQAKKVLAVPRLAKAVQNGTETVHHAVQQIKAKREAKEVHRDATGYPIPDRAMALWNRRHEVDEVLKSISKARCAVRDAMEKDDILFGPSNMSGTVSELSHSYNSVQLSVPYAVCATCQGVTADKCTSCKGRAFVSKHHFDMCVPEELKAIRAKSCVK